MQDFVNKLENKLNFLKECFDIDLSEVKTSKKNIWIPISAFSKERKYFVIYQDSEIRNLVEYTNKSAYGFYKRYGVMPINGQKKYYLKSSEVLELNSYFLNECPYRTFLLAPKNEEAVQEWLEISKGCEDIYVMQDLTNMLKKTYLYVSRHR